MWPAVAWGADAWVTTPGGATSCYLPDHHICYYDTASTKATEIIHSHTCENVSVAAGSQVDLAAHATDGGSLTIKEGADDGSNTFTLKVPDGGLSATVTCTLTADGLIPASCLE